jgi:hypothetical protein
LDTPDAFTPPALKFPFSDLVTASHRAGFPPS